MAGTDKIKELGSMFKDGFSFIKGSSVSEILKAMTGHVGTGIGMAFG